MTTQINHHPIDLAQTLAADIATRATKADRDGRLPAADVALLRESGYLTLAVPREYGGRGESLLTCTAAQLELAKGSASTALVAAMQHQVIGHQRETRTWRPDAREQIMREAAAGGLLNHLGKQNRALGTLARGGLPDTTATPVADGGQLLVNGRKTWATGGRHPTHLLVRVAVGEQGGVVLVRQGDDDTPGIEWIETWRDALSLRATDSNDVVFHDAVARKISNENLHRDRQPPPRWAQCLVPDDALGRLPRHSAGFARDGGDFYGRWSACPPPSASPSPPCRTSSDRWERSTWPSWRRERCCSRWPGRGRSAMKTGRR